MTRYEHAPSGNLRHRRIDHKKSSPLLPMLAFLASVSAPLAAQAQAQDAPDPLCAGCHNPDGNSIIPEFPKLAGLDAAYIAKQIKDFKNYKRVSEIMGPMSGNIAEADIGALAAYYSKQKRTPGTVTDRNLAAQGQVIYDEGVDSSAVPACAGCHEKGGGGSKKFPRLAGQHQAYLIGQMNNFKNGVRNNDGRMRAVAKRMTGQEITAVAEYIAGLKGDDQ